MAWCFIAVILEISNDVPGSFLLSMLIFFEIVGAFSGGFPMVISDLIRGKGMLRSAVLLGVVDGCISPRLLLFQMGSSI